MNAADATRGLILGAVFDFVLRCCNRDPAIIVGKGYPRDKFIEEFEAWARANELKLDKIDLDQFRAACKAKLLG
jgi:hypothetical protein